VTMCVDRNKHAVRTSLPLSVPLWWAWMDSQHDTATGSTAARPELLCLLQAERPNPVALCCKVRASRFGHIPLEKRRGPE
jgi:hypothetical protein